ncbi:MAG: SRPBCC family protein [Bacteroidetes bacterium]|nr:SRPBCC family protein [Bacteroidota bacterium]
MYQLRKVQKLPIDIKKAWDFFSSPANLAVITPDEMGFIVKTELPEKMYAGMMIEYTVKPLLGIPLTWVTEITHVEEGRYFVDEQRTGPYAIWHHQHFFEEIPGGVKMTDIIDYQLPLAPFGNFLHKPLVRPKLEQIFDYRWNKLIELFGAYKEPELTDTGIPSATH